MEPPVSPTYSLHKWISDLILRSDLWDKIPKVSTLKAWWSNSKDEKLFKNLPNARAFEHIKLQDARDGYGFDSRIGRQTSQYVAS